MIFSEPIVAVSPGLHGRVLAVLARTDTPLTGRTIASLVKPEASQRGTQRVLNDLVRNGLVRSQPAGNARLYTFNREHVAGPAITTLVNLREELLTRMAAAVDSWQTPALAVWLFGSAARGEADPDSDIDVLVLRPDAVLDSDQTWQDQVDTFSMRVTQWAGNGCEVLEYGRSEFDDLVRRDERIVTELLRDAIPLSGESPRQVIGRRGKR